MKTKVLFVFFALAATMAYAQTNIVVSTSTFPLPESRSQYWDAIIACLTPVLVTGIYKMVPRVPKVVLPLLTPVLGVCLGAILNWLTNINLSWIDMAKAGGLAVFIREVTNQAITKQLQTSTPSVQEAEPSSIVETPKDKPNV